MIKLASLAARYWGKTAKPVNNESGNRGIAGLILWRALHFFRLHDWRDDDRQTRRIHYQHCALCPKRRAVERESFTLKGRAR